MRSLFIPISGAVLAAALALSSSQTARAQAAASENIVVTGYEGPSAYGAPPAFSRSRFSNLTNAYVLPAWTFYFGTIYEGDAYRNSAPDHLFTQEIEMGLPYRFGIATETTFEHFDGGGGPLSTSVELRYALADWNKIPLNPTLFFEYKFGIGPIRHEEVPPPPGMGDEEEGGPPQRPNSYEVRLLLAQEFFKRYEWAFNMFFEKENTGDRGREWGFAQSIATPVLLPNERLKVGLEMQYNNLTVKDTRGDPQHSFVIGPTGAWKPSKSTRFDVSTLFGCTEGAPQVQVFAVFSWLIGPAGGEGQEAEAPVSTRNR